MPGPGSGPGRSDPGPQDAGRPPGFAEQLSATRQALTDLARAHVDLARAEFEVIGGEVKRALSFTGLAAGAIVLLAFLLPIGLALFLGEWLFGSLGWGVLHASELLVAVAIAAVLAALRVPGVGRSLGVALVIGALVAVLLGLNLPNQLYARIGESLGLAVDPGVRPLVVGLAFGALVVGILGLLAGARASGSRGAVGGLILGALVGAAVGALSAITFDWRVAVALGLAVALALWSGLMGASVAESGIDTEALTARFLPRTTIDTTKETIEWIRARVPLAPKS
jgi:hypothetical protein